MPVDRVDEIVASHHHGAFGGHYDPLRAIARTWWWASQRADVERMRAECSRCQAFARLPARGEALFVGADAQRLATVSIDLAELPAAAGAKFVLVAVDSASGAVEAAALPNKQAATVASAFERIWLYRYAVPQLVISDNGTEFEGTWRALGAQYGFEHRHTSPHNPKGNGLAERAVQSIKARLDKLCARADLADWPLHLDAALASIRMHSGVRGHSPFEILHGVQPRLPAEARLNIDATTTMPLLAPATSTTDTVADVRARTAKLLVAVQQRRLERQRASAARLSQHQVEPLAVHDIVMWQSHTSSSKFAARRHYVGPFIIIAEAPFGQFFQIARPDGSYATTRFVPARQLKLFVGDPFSADSPGILAEPGARPWLGLDHDRSLLGERFDRFSVVGSTPATPTGA